jgi:hypothetical protein
MHAAQPWPNRHRAHPKVQGMHMLRRSLALLLLVSPVFLLAQSADRPIYRCVMAGVITFSDRPCGDAIEVHSLDVPDLPTPAAPGSTSSRSTSPRSARAVTGQPQGAAAPVRARRPTAANSSNRKDSRAGDSRVRDSRVRECLRLGAELRRLTARMRAGYGAAEGERLRERQRTAKERRRDLACR